MLSKEKALTAAREIFFGPRSEEQPRLERIDKSLATPTEFGDEWTPNVIVPQDAPPIMRQLAWKSETNYLRMLVQLFSQVLKVDGVIIASDEGEEDPWTAWQRNRMDARQTGLHRSALKYGGAYATILPGQKAQDGVSYPRIDLYTPREMTALYQDPEADEWPMMTLSVRGRHVYLMDEEAIYIFGWEDPRPSWLTPASSLAFANPYMLQFIESRVHGLGYCPAVRYRDRFLLNGEEQFGIVEPLIQLQERINETTFQTMVIQYVQAFRQRLIVGWSPETSEEEFKASAAKMFYIEDNANNITVHDLAAVDLTPMIKSQESAKRDFAALGQIPAQALGVDGISNVSDATLAGLELQRNREAGEIATSFGESHEQLLRTCGALMGNEVAAHDWKAEVMWKPFEARTMAAIVDALGKMVTQLGLPPEIALEDVPGMTAQRLARVKEAMRAKQSRDLLAQLGVATPGTTPDATTPAPKAETVVNVGPITDEPTVTG